ncbi:Guanine nucleotide exchange factor SPIKE 1 [Vitis vinifera]|uniref:Guanine nucleotide exchange factor SPIKE 1 n=1 Tax=Vitis vinifera TaxID=29760 RepID=A0A438GXS8_VITVI|nr:Guanine nucleotide exchange factor SPIKE 1 [Vitis vinifera]
MYIVEGVEGVRMKFLEPQDCTHSTMAKGERHGLAGPPLVNSDTLHPEEVSLYLDKFSGVCQSVLHDCKLTFLQIICDHDLFVEMPGRDPSDRVGLAPPRSIVDMMVIAFKERNNRIFEDKGRTEEMLWDLLLFYSSLWASCTAAFSGVTISVLQLNWTVNSKGKGSHLLVDSFYLRKFLLNDGCSLENPIKMGLEESIGIIRKICYISSLKWQEMEWQLQTLFEGLKVVLDGSIIEWEGSETCSGNSEHKSLHFHIEVRLQ